MAHDPADVRSGPIYLTGSDVVDVSHTPQKRHGMPAIVPDNAFGYRGRAGCVQNVERIGGGNGNAICRHGRGFQLVPIKVPAGYEFGFFLRSLKDYALFGLRAREFYGFIQQWLVRDDSLYLNAARSRKNYGSSRTCVPHLSEEIHPGAGRKR
jgi:hypothetical protein